MLTFDDKGGWGGGSKKPPKPAYVIHGCSLKNISVYMQYLGYITLAIASICNGASCYVVNESRSKVFMLHHKSLFFLSKMTTFLPDNHTYQLTWNFRLIVKRIQ